MFPLAMHPPRTEQHEASKRDIKHMTYTESLTLTSARTVVGYGSRIMAAAIVEKDVSK